MQQIFVSPLVFRACELQTTLLRTQQTRGGKQNISYPIAKVFDEEVRSKTPYAIANRIAQKKKEKMKWIQPKDLTPEKQRELAVEKPPKKLKISERQQELLDQIVQAGKEKNPMDAFEAYKRLDVSPTSRIYLGLLQACESDGDFLGEAIQIYHDLRKHNIIPQLAIFQSLQNICLLAGHMPRAMFFIKEMNKHKYKKDEKLQAVYETAIRTCIQQKATGRAMTLYKMMVEKKLFKALENAAQYKKNCIPLDYVKTLISADVDAHTIWLEMNRTVRPNFNGEILLEETKPFDEALIEVFPGDEKEAKFRALAARLSGADRDFNEPIKYNEYGNKTDLLRGEASSSLSARQQIVIASPKFKFYAYSADPAVNLLNQQAWTAQFGRRVTSLFEDYLDRSGEERSEFQEELLSKLIVATKGAKKEHRPLVKSVFDDVLRRSYYCTNENELGGLLIELKETLASLSRQIRTKVNWLPVIIGLDGQLFFPKSIGMDMVTREKVKMAKMEYLQTIPEEAAKEVISKGLFSKIQIQWYDVDRRCVVEGFVH